MTPTVYAHRGASFELPENTIESFGLALSLGADAIETDAHLSRDGHVVLLHDASLARTAGVDRAVSSFTLTELRTFDVGARFVPRRASAFVPGRVYRIPTLEEALEAFPGILLNVDAKQREPDMVPALVRAIRRARAEDRVRIASFSRKTLARVRALGYAGQTGLAPSEVAQILFVPKPFLSRLRVRGHAAQIPQRAYGISLATQEAIDRFHAVGVRVDYWTIDEPSLAMRLFALGADGVMTDDPRALCARS